MPSVKTTPFVRPSPIAIELGSWSWEGRTLYDGMLAQDWDPSTDLSLSCFVQADTGMLLQTGMLDPQSHLAFVSTWWSSGTGLRGSGGLAHLVLDGTKRRNVDLAIKIPGSQLRDSVQIRTALILLSVGPRTPINRATPRRPGSVLWEQSIRLILEGTASRFPVTAVDFSQSSFADEKGCWVLEWSPRELDAPAMACLRLYLNKRHPSFYKGMILSPPSPSALAFRSALKCGVAEHLVRIALENSKDLSDVSEIEGSMGKVLLDLLDALFPGLSPNEIVQLRDTDPVRFHSRIQAGTQLFDGIPV